MRIAAAALLSLSVILSTTPAPAATVTPSQMRSATQKLGALNPVFLGSSFDVAVFRGRALSEGGLTAGRGGSLSELLSTYVVFGEGKISATSFFNHADIGHAGHF